MNQEITYSKIRDSQKFFFLLRKANTESELHLDPRLHLTPQFYLPSHGAYRKY